MSTFCNYLSSITSDISLEQKSIFSSEYTCFIDSIILINQSEQDILIDLSLLRQEESNVKTTTFLKKLSLGKDQSIDWMFEKKALHTQPGDFIFASSTYSDAFFSTIVSYRELKEKIP